jgi:transcriptional regulator with XRE-family HTH domain
MHLIPVPTPTGCRRLGYFLRSQREAKRWSLDRLCSIIYAQVQYRNSAGQLEAYYVTKGTLSSLEQGKTLNPDMTLLAAIAAVGFAQHPSANRAFTAEELRAIICEQLDPETGMALEVASEFPVADEVAVVA